VSLVLAFAPAIAAKVKSISAPAETVEKIDMVERRLFDKAMRTCAKLLDQRRKLEAELAIANERNATLQRNLELERLMADQARREAHYQMHAAAEYAMRHAQQNQLAQYQQGLAGQQSNLALQAQAMQMQNAQNVFAFGDFCNCVPARHDMLLTPALADPRRCK
jgi:hypothetical protein